MVGLLGAFVLALLSGRLKTRRDHEDRVTDLKERIQQIAEERDGWRQAHETSEGTRRIMAEQLDKLLAGQTVIERFLASLKGEANDS